MKTIHTLLAAMTIAMLAISCENEFDVSDKADSLISVTVNTLNNQAAYNVGETAQAELWIQRGGLKDASGKVQFVVDPLLLDSLNQEDKTNYELLPENCYEMTNTETSYAVTSRTILKRYWLCQRITKQNLYCHYDSFLTIWLLIQQEIHLFLHLPFWNLSFISVMLEYIISIRI